MSRWNVKLADRTYTSNGLLSKIANSAGDNVEYTYDGANRELTCYQAYPNKTVQHVYQKPNDKTLTVNIRNGNGTAGALLGTYTHEYDGDWRPAAITNPKGIKTTYDYDPGTGLLSKVTYNANALPAPANPPGCPYTLLGYDTATHKRLWLTSVGNYRSDGSKISTFDYLYDNVGNRIKMTEADGAYTNYAYDSSYQLLSEDRKTSGGVQVYNYEYQYDEAGNRTQKKLTNSAPGSPRTYTYIYADNNLLTNITGATTCAFSYDNLGNQTERNITSTPASHWYYKYDSKNHLTSLGTTSGGSQIGSFRYDALGRRDGRTDKSRKFVYYENSLLAETDGSNNIIAWYTPGISQSRLEGAVWNTYYYHCDGQGTTRELTDSLQRLTDAYAYNAYGEDLGELRDQSDPAKPVNPLRYVGTEGYYTDIDTGLMLLGARYYDPNIGRFITQDPIRDGLNWYAYCGNNPVNAVDPTGMFSYKDATDFYRYWWSGAGAATKGGLSFRLKDVDWGNNDPFLSRNSTEFKGILDKAKSIGYWDGKKVSMDQSFGFVFPAHTPEAIIFGSCTLHLKGTFTFNTPNDWKFEGQMQLSDTYNFDNRFGDKDRGLIGNCAVLAAGLSGWTNPGVNAKDYKLTSDWLHVTVEQWKRKLSGVSLGAYWNSLND